MLHRGGQPSSAIIGTLLEDHDLSIWVYQGIDWFVLDLDGPHVTQEARGLSVRTPQGRDFDGVLADVIKIVGVSDAPDAVARAQRRTRRHFGDDSATSSQPYYLDITDCGRTRAASSTFFGYRSIERTEIAAIGDMANDVSMFDRSGISVAMGNATDEVKSRAAHVTKSNNDDGFAYAIEHFILGENP